MNITELDSYRLGDAVKFHNRLNPKLWGRDEHLLPEVQAKLMEIAADFQEFLGITDLDVEDITISGSNAAFSYTPHSDIDLHLVVRKPAEADEVYQELFNAKKYQYNDMHDIRIHGADVELYVQDAAETPVSLGEYSVKNSNWIQVPKKKRAQIDQSIVKHKYEDLVARIQEALKTDDAAHIAALLTKIKTMRQTGLDQHGEFGPENLAFKILRKQGYIQKLYAAQADARDRELSLNERRKKKRRVRYGYGSYYAPGFNFGGSGEGSEGSGDGGGGESIREVNTGMAQGSSIGDAGAQSTWDGVSPDTDEFLSEDSNENIVQDFIQVTAHRLGIERMPTVELHQDSDWSRNERSFGMYEPESHTLHVNMANRHLMDILRTTAHELTHCRQHEISPLPDRAGDTGSKWENQAHATAGVIMRDYAEAHPELFEKDSVAESSGYIPTAAQKNDPRFAMALSPDVRPGATGKNANKMALQTGPQGEPALLIKGLRNALREFKETGQIKEIDRRGALQDLFEVAMTSKNLAKLAAQIDAKVGLEFEMIVPNGGMDDVEPEYEPDWDQDQRSRSFSDVRDFFDDGDYNGRRAVDDLMEELQNEYEEWTQEQIVESWEREGAEFMQDYISLNDLFDRDEALNVASAEIVAANPDIPDQSEDFTQLLTARVDEMEREFAQSEFEDQGRVYNDAFEAFTEEQREEYDERSFLDDKYPYMRDIQSNFDISWPYYTDINDGQGGDMDIANVALEFMNSIGDTTIAYSDSYHGTYYKWVDNNWVDIGDEKPDDCFTVEPDGSLKGNEPGDKGLEFVSPPIPLKDIGTVMSKVQNWAGIYGAYTGDQNKTSIHTNISIPGYDLNKLDYLKAALLLGDEYVLREFDRIGNTYAAPAIEKVKQLVKQNPDKAKTLLDKMKSQLNAEASKLIHSGITDKFTSINTKDNRVEFRSPGGDYLSIIADNPQKMQDTINRMVVTLDAAMDPDKYKQEYQKKLYKMLTGQQSGREAESGKKQEMKKDDKDLLNIFSRYAAGELPKTALKSFVRQAQLERNVEKGKQTGKMWWSVSRPGYFASVELVASSKEEAIEKGKKEYPDWRNAQDMIAKPLRPYVEPQAAGPSLNDRPSNPDGNWVIVDTQAPRTPVYRFMAANDRDALLVLRQWIAANPGSQWTFALDANQQMGQPGPRSAAQPSAGNWGIWMNDMDRFARAPGQSDNSVLRRFPSREAAEQFITQGREQNSRMRTDLEVREIEPSQPVPGSTLDLQRQRAADAPVNRNTLAPTGPGPWEVFRISDGSSVAELEQTNRLSAEVEARGVIDQRREAPDLYGVRTRAGTDAAQGGTVDVAGDNWSADFERRMQKPATAPQTLTRPGQGQQTFTGEWKIVDANDRELHRFGGVGNNQGDANRVAMVWLRQNPQRMQDGVEVLPVMG